MLTQRTLDAGKRVIVPLQGRRRDEVDAKHTTGWAVSKYTLDHAFNCSGIQMMGQGLSRAVVIRNRQETHTPDEPESCLPGEMIEFSDSNKMSVAL
jgi:hypothetical protein